ncbi:flagellar basal body P-ring biosynthesis protein FlgA [Candidatus Megaera venefica]|uniref:Flagella basal body P-ring formation protein FlgA n=1 Tax=Candidatus Megaera venefica TaxID=2055910 RepID=A0ABU5NAY9_9RICK|nr:flagellar basal body P-ring formation chaperone FlgA [Candidatus Megaera venefica]MEA0970336.1 flagellar basal body P-ring biosynthesis protein FlgA [Candidatus Megaera venefica]
MKLLSSLLFLCITLLTLFALADEDFVSKTINGLLQEKIQDNRIIIEQEYSSKSKFDKIKSAQDKIDSIIVEQFEPKNSSFRVRVNYNDGKAETLSGRYLSYVMAPIAARYIKFGDVIQQSDVTTMKVRIDSLNSEYASELNEVVGMQAKTYIAAGKMFKINEVTSPNVIKNNDPVNIIYSSGAINLKTVGIAMGNGAVGDMIKVKNSSSGVVLLGQIVNKNTVKIGGENE